MVDTQSVGCCTVSSDYKRQSSNGLGEYVCWSRMQAEAGQTLDAILARKERERLAGDGHFLWGVGNAPALAIRALVRLRRRIPVVFSLMKTKARAIDASPARILIWRRYIDTHGVERSLPDNALVTSRGGGPKGPKKVHYALMCRSDGPLHLQRGDAFDHRAYRNATSTGAPVGSSQVTALLKPSGEPSSKAEYEVNLYAWLAESYWVRLTDPLELSPFKVEALARCTHLALDHWSDFVGTLRSGQVRSCTQYHAQLRWV